MKNYKVFHSYPDYPLTINQEQCDQVSFSLRKMMGQYYQLILPKVDIISDTEIYKLTYLDTALRVIKDCEGFEKHLSEYKNDVESSFFVTILSDLFVGYGLKVVLEPEVPGHLKRADIYACQTPNGLGIYFECKQPKEDTSYLLQEQLDIFEGIKELLNDNYSYAIFYKNRLSFDDIVKFRNLISIKLSENPKFYENFCIVDDSILGIKLVVSGISIQIEKNSKFIISGIPNYSPSKGYSNANGINYYGKNIVFYKSGSNNTIKNQLQNSRGKVPRGFPYVVCIDLSGPKFDLDQYTSWIANHFKFNDSGISGVLLVEHGVTIDGAYAIELRFIENLNAIYPLPFLMGFWKPIHKVDILKRRNQYL